MYAVGDASGQWTGLRLADLWAVLSRAVPGSVSASNRTAVTRPALGMLASPWAAPIHRVVIDSRQAGPDTLFVALRGEQTDGHRFVGDAFARGAVCAIVEQSPDAQAAEAGVSVVDLKGPRAGARALPDRLSTPLCLIVPDSLMALQQISTWWRSLFDVRVIGITGSIGKTTTKEYVGSVLSQRYNVLKSEGNYNNEIGLPLTLLRLDPTIERAVLEMGTYGLGEIRLLTQIARPQVGLVTNVGPVHLERMGTIERIVQAKSELPQALPPDGVAILNGDDERVRSMAGQTSARVFTYGRTPGCDLWADQVESLGLEGIRFRLHWQSETIPVQLPVTGRHSVYTALRAAAVGLVEGLSWPEIVEGLRTGEQLRLTPVPAIMGATLIDDTYNSSPESALAALDLLAELEGRKIAVLGDMLELGPAELEGHRRVARRVVDVVSILVTVGERGRWIGEHALELGMPAAQVLHAGGNEAAIAYLERVVQAGDKVLVKGSRGMAMEQIVQALARK
jgi:UDP-N-acetylmuramoyl-tripeptide--D-alanyl-D-alanine ligase